MRCKAFDLRSQEDLAKPHLPFLSSDEKDKIMEEYFAAKKELKL